MTPGGTARIDVHSHVVVEPWAKEIRQAAPGRPVRPWSVDEALAFMDELEIEKSVLSVTAPGVHFGDDVRAREVARATNESVATAIADHSDRFAFFATLPLPDVEGTLEEIEAAYALGCAGVTILTNSRGIYPGDPRFSPVWEELEQRRAVVFSHPNWTTSAGPPDMSAALADFLLDTVRAATDLIRARVMRDFPSVSVILSHAGGFLPYTVHRIAAMYSTMLEPPMAADDVISDARKFYVDLALSTSPTSLPSLLAFADPSRILYGSDWPYALPETIRYFDRLFREQPLDPGLRQAIERGNAQTLFSGR